MAIPEVPSPSQFKEGLFPLKKEMERKYGNDLRRWSQRIRTHWLRKPEQKKTDPKELGREVEIIDVLLVPVLFTTEKIFSKTPQLSRKFLNYTDITILKIRFQETIYRCCDRIIQGEQVTVDVLKSILEDVADEEITPKIQKIFRSLERQRQTYPLDEFFFLIHLDN